MYLDPKNDIVFKRIFGEHPNVVISLLNALLPIPNPIQSIEYLPVEQVPDVLGLKNTLVDVKCKDNTGRIFIVEMQNLWTRFFKQRVLFNASKAYVRQLETKMTFDKLRPVYSLNFVNEHIYAGENQYYRHYAVCEIADSEKRIEGLEFIFIDLVEFQRQLQQQAVIERKTIQALWLRFLTEINERVSEPPADLTAVNEIAFSLEICRKMAMNEAALALYEKYWDEIRVEKTNQEIIQELSEEKQELMQEKQELMQEKQELMQEKQELLQEKQELMQEKQELMQEKQELMQEKQELMQEKQVAETKAEQLAAEKQKLIDLLKSKGIDIQ